MSRGVKVNSSADTERGEAGIIVYGAAGKGVKGPGQAKSNLAMAGGSIIDDQSKNQGMQRNTLLKKKNDKVVDPNNN